MSAIDSMTSAELVKVYNKLTGENVKRFADRKTGLARVRKAADSPEGQRKLEEFVLGGTVAKKFDDGSPIPTIAEAAEQIAASDPNHAKNEAKRAEKIRKGREKLARDEEAAKAKTARKGKGPKELTPTKKPRSKTAATPQTLAKPIEGSHLVSFGGRVVRPENVARIQKGEAIWGAVGAAPSEKDRLTGRAAGLNLNYPAKKTIKPLREGTGRAKLVAIMRSKGVTIEDVMSMFSLTHDQAVYKIRDLNYMAGHGIVTRHGRIYVTDTEKDAANG